MQTVHLIVVLLISAIACMLIRIYRPEYASVLTICVGLCTLFALLPQFAPIEDLLDTLAQTNPSIRSFCTLLFKIMGIAYLAQFASDVCIDSGEKAMAQKIVLTARVGILVLCLPALTHIVQMLYGMLDGLP